MRFLLKKLLQPYVLRRVFRERLTEPLHLNIIAAFVAVFGSYRQKIAFDLVLRPHNAYALHAAAWRARAVGCKRLTAVEFGVAAGAGLLNMARIASRLSRLINVEIEVVGFDSGCGMPAARDYRDHPDRYWEGNYPMDRAQLERRLPPNARLVFGDIANTAPRFLTQLTGDAPVGYVVLDVDYYWSTCEALRLFEGPPELYLPITEVYVDDINLELHNRACGAWLALAEYNAAHPLRPIERDEFLVHSRIFKHPMWLSQIFKLHVLDHPSRSRVARPDRTISLENPYL